jgi:two-component system OmpR family sensor kinase
MTGPTRLPIRLRLTVAFAAGLALVLATLSAFVYIRTGADLLAATDAGLRSRAELLASDVRQRGPAPVNVEPDLTEPDEAFAQIADSSGRIVRSSSIVSPVRLIPETLVGSIGGARFLNRTVPGIDNVARVLAVPVATSGGRFVVVVGESLQDRRDEQLQLAATLAIAGTAALGLVSLGAWFLVGGVVRPVERMRRQVAAISASDPARRLSMPHGRDEIGLLGLTLNEMLDRIEESVERERRLVDRASHELRTPLAVQRMDLDLALSGPQGVEDLAAALRSVSEENDHLTTLAQDLLVLSRARAGALPVHRVVISLSVLMEEAQKRNAASAEAAAVHLDFTAPAVPVELDPAWMRQAIDNLVDNALRHTPPGGCVRVFAEPRDDAVHVVVEDSGSGFPDAILIHAFEPFARTVQGNGDGQGGTGLGLAVVRSIAEAHGGRAWAQNRPEGGARLTMVIRATT